jgi:spore germination cell wall hydrolase CwlJ-like protein
MTRVLSSLERAFNETSGATRSRLAFGGAVFVAMLLSLAFLLGNPDLGRAESSISFKSRELAQLNSMDKGDQAEILEQGMNAQERNDLIPISGMPMEEMERFAVIGAANAQYSSAHKCLTQAVYYEAANEPLAGKRAVAQVVINRLRHPAYPNSVCGVVYEGVNDPVCQFSFTCDGSLLRKPLSAQWAQSSKVAEQALAGTIETLVGSATHYHADYVLPRWAFTLAKINKVGMHVFYRFPGNAGREMAFTRRWNGRESVPYLTDARLRQMLNGRYFEEVAEPEFTPGLTVTPHVTDRHAPTDVGGRIDTTKSWRLSIPDPVNAQSTYETARTVQGEAIEAGDNASGGEGVTS